MERQTEQDLLNKGRILAMRSGLQFPPGLPFEAWEQAGPKLFEIVESSTWYLGDWLVYGQEQFDDRYRIAIENAGLDYQTLRNYAWVARKLPLARRRDSLSFQHHAEVAALDPAAQDEWLDRAERLGWSRNQLRKALRDSRNGGGAPVSDASKTPSLHVPRESVERWRAAARDAGTALERWIVATLDRAARVAVAAPHTYGREPGRPTLPTSDVSIAEDRASDRTNVS